jgi:hypothetical protein
MSSRRFSRPWRGRRRLGTSLMLGGCVQLVGLFSGCLSVSVCARKLASKTRRARSRPLWKTPRSDVFVSASEYLQQMLSYQTKAHNKVGSRALVVCGHERSFREFPSPPKQFPLAAAWISIKVARALQQRHRKRLCTRYLRCRASGGISESWPRFSRPRDILSEQSIFVYFSLSEPNDAFALSARYDSNSSRATSGDPHGRLHGPLVALPAGGSKLWGAKGGQMSHR